MFYKVNVLYDILTNGQGSEIGTMTKDWLLPHILLLPSYFFSLAKDTEDLLMQINELLTQKLAFYSDRLGIFVQLTWIKEGLQYASRTKEVLAELWQLHPNPDPLQ